MNQVFVRIENLCKSFGDKVLFDNFNCTINQGEFVVITGASGCGKTTLLNMIGGLEKVSSGKIYVSDIDITSEKSLQKYYRDVIGFVFQNFALVEQKTVEDNLKMIHKKGKNRCNYRTGAYCCGNGAGTKTESVFFIRR